MQMEKVRKYDGQSQYAKVCALLRISTLLAMIIQILNFKRVVREGVVTERIKPGRRAQDKRRMQVYSESFAQRWQVCPLMHHVA